MVFEACIGSWLPIPLVIPNRLHKWGSWLYMCVYIFIYMYMHIYIYIYRAYSIDV